METKKENLISKFFHLPKTIVILTVVHLFFSIGYCRNILFENCIGEVVYAIAGFLIIFILNFILSKIDNSKLKYKKIFSVIFSIFSILTMLFFEFVGVFMLILFGANLKNIIPRKPFYPMYVQKMSENDYRIKHFPKKLPKNASKYYFEIEQDFFGYDIDYLKFKTDENYINKTIEENKDDIFETIEMDDINNSYKFIDSHFKIKDKENYTVYILKNENDDSRYTSGILTSKNNDILFFYSNYSLRKQY